MTTIAEALQNAADALNRAVTDVLGIRDKIAADLAAKTAQATTVINQFIGRAQVNYFYVDPANGSDANDGRAYATAFRSVDYCVNTMDKSVTSVIYLFSDDVIRKASTIYANVSIVGALNAPGPLGSSISFAQRKVSFAAEATNSPAAGLGRLPGCLFAGGNVLSLAYLNLSMPLIDAALNVKSLINGGSMTVTFENCTLQCDSAASPVSLLSSSGPGRVETMFSNFTLGQNAAGKVFAGISAGSDPNTNYQYISNLKSA